MAVIKRRTRMISVRFTQEEYIALKSHCSLTGARSVSGLTRDTLASLLRANGTKSAQEANLQEIQSSLKLLEDRIWHLESKLS